MNVVSDALDPLIYEKRKEYCAYEAGNKVYSGWI